jgi:hypothetical protein
MYITTFPYTNQGRLTVHSLLHPLHSNVQLLRQCNSDILDAALRHANLKIYVSACLSELENTLAG